MIFLVNSFLATFKDIWRFFLVTLVVTQLCAATRYMFGLNLSV